MWHLFWRKQKLFHISKRLMMMMMIDRFNESQWKMKRYSQMDNLSRYTLTTDCENEHWLTHDICSKTKNKNSTSTSYIDDDLSTMTRWPFKPTYLSLIFSLHSLYSHKKICYNVIFFCKLSRVHHEYMHKKCIDKLTDRNQTVIIKFIMMIMV